MNEDTKRFMKGTIAFGIVILISILFMLWLFDANQIYDKARRYEVYKSDLDKLQSCLPYEPIVLCPVPSQQDNRGLP